MESLQRLLEPEVQRYLIEHQSEDVHGLLFKHKEILKVPASLIAQQIDGRRRIQHKLPLWYQNNSILFPPKVNLEQSSSSITAELKANIVASRSPSPKFDVGVDLTGGFGVDSYYLSRLCKAFHYVEPDETLLAIAQHNHHALGANNIVYHCSSAENFLAAHDSPIDFVYIDPSRRNQSKKVFRFSDCVPDVVASMDSLFRKTSLVMVKASPLMDLQNGEQELKYVSEILVVAVRNEMKEIIFVCTTPTPESPPIRCINFTGENVRDDVTFLRQNEIAAQANFSPPRRYLFEPNTALLKGGAFKLISEKYGVAKLHPNTHLYTSDQMLINFPGKVFEIIELKPNLKTLPKYFPDGKANVTARNYPLSPEELKKKYRLSDGGELFLIGFSAVDQKYLCVARRVSSDL